MIRMKNLLAENMRRFNTKNLSEQTNPIQYLNHIIDFDVNDLGDVERQMRLGKELDELDKIVDTNENIPEHVAEKIFELGDFYIGQGGIADANGFHEYLNKYKKLLSRYMSKEINFSTLKFDGVDPGEYPYFTNAFVDYAEYEDGTPLTDEELERLDIHDDERIYDALMNRLRG